MSVEGTDMLVCVRVCVSVRRCGSVRVSFRFGCPEGPGLASHLSLSVPSLLCPQTSVPSGPPR